MNASRKKILVFVFTLACIFGTWKWTVWHWGYESATFLIGNNSQTTFKTILLLTPTLGRYSGWERAFSSQLLSCGQNTCRITSDHSHIEEASAVLVSLSDINSFIWTWLPRVKPEIKRNQLWVIYWKEAPWFYYQKTIFSSAAQLKSLNNIFNWIVSYRMDSDIISSYFQTSKDYCSWIPLEKKVNKVDNSLMSSKSELAIWIVSHCTTSSKRENFVREMKKFMPITVLGKCSKFGKDKSAFGNVNWHKFYLSFENSLCDDYITEKFFEMLLNYNTVPVVMGPPKKNYELLAPPNSFIHAEDFAGPRELSEYLLYLDRNTTEYLKYLDWKNWYAASCEELWSCRLCRSLYQQQQPTKVISDFESMWNKKSCYSDWTYKTKY